MSVYTCVCVAIKNEVLNLTDMKELTWRELKEGKREWGK